MDQPLFQALFDEQEHKPLSVSELTDEIKTTLERRFASVWVEGEVVDFTAAKSGHWFITLGDGAARLRRVCWKTSNYRIRFRPQAGLSVRMRGLITVYPTSGEYQLVVESLEPAGEGALAIAFEQIKAKLEAEGLFDMALKRPLPFFPRKIGVVTSQTGAAYHGIFSVLTRRAGSISIVLIPTLVQGESAADMIREAITDANRYNSLVSLNDRIEVLIVGRGGGSAEDLWAFNDEMLARAIRASAIPVISAVGHEIDLTIADLVADLRAPTPSAAAEVVAGREVDILNAFVTREQDLIRIINFKLLDLDSGLGDSRTRLRSHFTDRVYRSKIAFSEVASRLTSQTLAAKIVTKRNQLGLAIQRQFAASNKLLKAKDESLKVLMAKLDALSPLAVLDRGFSITQTADGNILRDAAKTKRGDKLKIRLANGKLNAEVLSSEQA